MSNSYFCASVYPILTTPVVPVREVSSSAGVPAPETKYPRPSSPPPAGGPSAPKDLPHNHGPPYYTYQASDPAPMMSPPNFVTYRYQNIYTGEVVTTLLPPDHPKMICLQEGHIRETKFGLLGMFHCLSNP